MRPPALAPLTSMRVWRFPLILILAAMIGAGAALWTWTRAGDPVGPGAGEQTVVVHLLDNGFHTDLALPRALLTRRGGPLAQAVEPLAPGDWIFIGWGDARFYVDQSPISSRLPDGARAFFRPNNPSVLMLDPETRDPAEMYPTEGRAALRLSPAAFARMADRIEASLDLSSGAPRIAAQRPGDDARFFRSRETFSILHLCNHWTGQVLYAAGLAVRPVRSLTSGEVMRTVRRAAPLDSGGPAA
ncbi:DUF2459 domain-containing protein [Brevundimonas sp. PAMC22021]|uniref:DUF2459 domain-containing protein n=1 Tax=Brevundimonas sp. PAMC22021 TaxID=2861285 RepID=UPI002103ECE7|nr:DUF2459 domain-containing protein [Brevundimonas sp. PAMC22021]